jgi:hypothetical protein
MGEPDHRNPEVAWMDEDDAEFDGNGKLQTNLTWMPMAREQVVPLASLAVCHVNIHKGCNFHIEKKYEAYLESWKNPAPKHCQRGRQGKEEKVIHADRLGMTFDCKTFE